MNQVKVSEKLYSIVIPTRDRHDTLSATIASVLNQSRPNFELVIVDNCSSSETRQAVASFTDHRIKYFRSDKRLSMSENWELGLSLATGDYVNILGDDDAILADAIEVAESIHSKDPEAIVSWLPSFWMWPDFLVESQQNLFHSRLSNRVEIRSSRDMLKQVFSSRCEYTELPTIYFSFIPRSVFKTVSKEFGTYFKSPIPDVYSGVVNAFLRDYYYFIFRPLSVCGVSRHSTGSSSQFPNADQRPIQQFENENQTLWSRPLDSRLASGQLTEVKVANALLCAKDNLFPTDDGIKFDMFRFLLRIAKNAPRRMGDRFEEVKAEIEDMARRNNIDPRRLKFKPAPKSSASNRIEFSYSINRRNKSVDFTMRTDPTLIPTVFELAKMASNMLPSNRGFKFFDRRSNSLMRFFRKPRKL